jgi:Ca2+-transporting ATPase
LRDEAGALLLPLTAVQLLWINIVTDGPPALALGLDHSSGVMRQKPRDPKAALLDSPSLRFIVVTGTVKALIGGALLVLMPRLGESVEATRTIVFLYASIGQLVFVYPSRRIGARPGLNWWVHLAVIFGVGLQCLTAYLAWLRDLLGLERPDMTAMMWAGGAVITSLGIAELWNLMTRSNSASEQ